MSDTENEELEANRYRFGGFRYSLRGPANRGPNDIIPEDTGLYAFPRHEELEEDESSSSE